jgi:hypothetical protein
MRQFLAAILICLSLPVFADAEAAEARELAPVVGVLTAEDIATARQRLLNLTDFGPEAMLLDAACCKVCSKGQACGDSCISRSKQCRKGPGCACDG